MDVHPPHEPIHSWRDFLLHLLTITVGLLIALGLEAAVEALHHRHIVREARENIHREFEQNEKSARGNLTHIQLNMDSMKADIQTAKQMARDSDATHHHYSMEFAFTWESFNESAWISARDSGALTYMPTDEVQRYADSYNQEEIVNNQSVAIFTEETQLSAPFLLHSDDEQPTPDELHAMMSGCAVVYTRLNTLHQIVEELQTSYAGTLQNWKP